MSPKQSVRPPVKPRKRNIGLSNSQMRMLMAIPWDAPVDVVEVAKQTGLRSGLNPAFALQDRGLVARVGINHFIRVRTARPTALAFSLIEGGLGSDVHD